MPQASLNFFDDVTSTFDVARAFITQKNTPAWIIAAQQTKGKGRRGRLWASPRGNFYGSYVAQYHLSAQAAAKMSFVASLAVYDALYTHGARTLALKWPNDVLINQKKIAGILLEKKENYLIFGIGINLISKPDDTSLDAFTFPPAHLAEYGITLDPFELAKTLRKTFHHYETLYLTQGFSPIREEWLMKAAFLEKEITARLPQSVIKGLFETVTQEGALVLSNHSGRHEITAADVFFGR